MFLNMSRRRKRNAAYFIAERREPSGTNHSDLAKYRAACATPLHESHLLPEVRSSPFQNRLLEQICGQSSRATSDLIAIAIGGAPRAAGVGLCA